MKYGFALIFVAVMVSICGATGDTESMLSGLYDAKEYQQIISVYTDSSSSLPASELIYVARSYFALGNDSLSLKYVEMILAKDSSFAPAYLYKGLSLTYLGRLDEAVSSLNEAIELKPDYGMAYSALADLCYNNGNLQDAKKYYSKAIENKCDSDRPYTMIPQIYSDLDSTELALEANYVAKDHISGDSESYSNVVFNIGLLELLAHNYVAAEKALIELTAIAPDDYHAHSKLIQAYYGQDKFEEAIPIKRLLYEAKSEGVLPEALDDGFCFDQFDWHDKLVLVWERFENNDQELYEKHIFYVLDDEGNIEQKMQTENSPISIELGGPRYVLCRWEGSIHCNFGIGFDEGFDYRELKAAVINVLNDELKPAASTTPSSGE